MKCRILFLVMFLFGNLCVKAQTSSSPSSPPQPAPSPRARTTSDVRAGTREVDEAFDQMRSLEIRRVEESSSHSLLAELARKIYRKPNKGEMKILSPAPEHLARYAFFLRQPETGIIKLNSDSSCAENSKVLAARENCLPYSMPGAGTAYSFRAESHRIPRLADLILSKNMLKTDGILQQGIMVNLGDIPLEEVTLQTRGLKYLVDFEPLSDVESLSKFERELSQGVKADGFVYGFGVYVKEQTTFALRSIAYKGKFMLSVNGLTYNEMDFDKRKDVLVAFRIIELERNGNITILWKLLARKDAPTWKIKQTKDEK